MNINAQLVEKTSKEGKKYLVIEVEITPTYKKVVFLDKAELELLVLSSKK